MGISPSDWIARNGFVHFYSNRMSSLFASRSGLGPAEAGWRVAEINTGRVVVLDKMMTAVLDGLAKARQAGAFAQLAGACAQESVDGHLSFYVASKSSGEATDLVTGLLPPNSRDRHGSVSIGTFQKISVARDATVEQCLEFVQQGLEAGILVSASGDDHPDALPPVVCDPRIGAKTSDTSPPRLIADLATYPRSPVLLLGSTTGASTVGLLYLASYLRQHGVEAYCQVNDRTRTRAQLRANLERLIGTVKPRLVGVSLKWFPHMARAIEICRLIKVISPETTTVIGGDTATRYCMELLVHDCIDYIVKGDGERPMLELCTGAADAVNTVGRLGRPAQEIKIEFVNRSETSSSSYLSHLDDILLDHTELMELPYVFVCTGRGCALNCFYCAAARENQLSTFGRLKPVFRGTAEIRNDIEVLKEYTSTLMWDFDLPNGKLDHLYEDAWRDLDLRRHFARFYSWFLPSDRLLDLMTSTFNFVDLGIDLVSLSERHRIHLSDMRGPRGGMMVKPQPTDRELLRFFDVAEAYPNLRVAISAIAGMPFYTEEDMKASEAMLRHLSNTYSTFNTLEWGRLHSQPGAPIEKDYEAYGLSRVAASYDEFMKVSRANLDTEPYPSASSLQYPFAYYQDRRLTGLVSKHYYEMTKILKARQKSARHLLAPQ